MRQQREAGCCLHYSHSSYPMQTAEGWEHHCPGSSLLGPFCAPLSRVPHRAGALKRGIWVESSHPRQGLPPPADILMRSKLYRPPSGHSCSPPQFSPLSEGFSAFPGPQGQTPTPQGLVFRAFVVRGWTLTGNHSAHPDPAVQPEGNAHCFFQILYLPAWAPLPCSPLPGSPPSTSRDPPPSQVRHVPLPPDRPPPRADDHAGRLP